MRRSIALFLLLAAGGCGLAPLGNDDLGRGGDSATATVTPHFSSLLGDYLGTCASCHAPGAPGRTSDIEMTLDFTTHATAYTTLTTGSAVGLMGPPSACNGAPLLVKGTPGSSLSLAILDENVRSSFDLPSFPSCDRLTIGDHTVKTEGPPSTAFLAAFSSWIQAGALDD